MASSLCPGLFCGRTPVGNESWSECGACPQGFRVTDNSSSVPASLCVPCLDGPSTESWMYLGFITIMTMIMHWFFIDMAANKQYFTKGQLILHLSAFLEVSASAVLTLLMFDPVGQFTFNACRVSRLADWYTLFHNPSPDYGDKLYCTQEAVYPLQTMVLVFYLLCIISMMMARPWLNKAWMKAGKSAVYCALYFLPIMAMLHTVAGGLIYYSFPYVSIIVSMISNAAHFSLKLDQSTKSLIKTSFSEMKNTLIIVGHWALLAYGIVALNQHLAFLAFVPLPAVFYIFTVKFTDPGDVHIRDERNNN